jgi:hypothetical protein
VWKISQYRTVFSDHYASCDSDTQLNIDVRLDILKEKGNKTGEPIVRYLEDGLCELKAKNERFIFFYQPGKNIIFVVAAHKNQRKLSRNYFDKAKHRRRKILSEQENKNVIIFPDQTRH